MGKPIRNSINRPIKHAKLYNYITFTRRQLSRMDSTSPRSCFCTIKQIGGMENKANQICLPGHEQTSAEALTGAINAHFGSICSALPAVPTNPVLQHAMPTITDNMLINTAKCAIMPSHADTDKLGKTSFCSPPRLSSSFDFNLNPNPNGGETKGSLTMSLNSPSLFGQWQCGVPRPINETAERRHAT